MARYHLAQLNIARMVAPIDDPRLADFVAGLEPINRLADASPGFVWRLQTEDGDATSIQAFDDPTILVNLSVWESVEALQQYVYRSGHTDYMRRRKAWFLPFDGPYVVLWWISAGQTPSVREARSRLEQLQRNGPSADAFTFRAVFPPPTDGS